MRDFISKLTAPCFHILQRLLFRFWYKTIPRKRLLDWALVDKMPLNCVLDKKAREKFNPIIQEMFSLAPAMMKRKIPEANVQQAFVLAIVNQFASNLNNPRILCVGSYEDTAAVCIKKLGYLITEIDPVLNVDLDSFYGNPNTKRSSYDIIFSTSVLEHVPDDVLFLKQVADLLAIGGKAVLTCDFNNQYKPGDRLPKEDLRFYTQRDFLDRLLPNLESCRLCDEPQWDSGVADFSYGGCQYTFATLVFEKIAV